MWSGAVGGSYGGRQGNAGGLKRQARRRAWGGRDEEAVIVLLDFGLGQRLEIGQNVGPGEGAAEGGDAILTAPS
jgi:hypothetical protein